MATDGRGPDSLTSGRGACLGCAAPMAPDWWWPRLAAGVQPAACLAGWVQVPPRRSKHIAGLLGCAPLWQPFPPPPPKPPARVGAIQITQRLWPPRLAPVLRRNRVKSLSRDSTASGTGAQDHKRSHHFLCRGSRCNIGTSCQQQLTGRHGVLWPRYVSHGHHDSPTTPSRGTPRCQMPACSPVCGIQARGPWRAAAAAHWAAAGGAAHPRRPARRRLPRGRLAAGGGRGQQLCD